VTDRNVTPLDRRTSAADFNNCSSDKSGERVFTSLYAAMNLNQVPSTQTHTFSFCLTGYLSNIHVKKL